MYKKTAKSLLGLKGFFPLNKVLLYTLSPEAAIIMGVLADAVDMCIEDKEGWFYQTGDTLEKFSGLSRYKQDIAINELEEVGLLEKKTMGMPARRHFRLNYNAIIEYTESYYQYLEDNNLEIGFCQEFKDYYISKFLTIEETQEEIIEPVSKSMENKVEELETKKIPVSKSIGTRFVKSTKLVSETFERNKDSNNKDSNNKDNIFTDPGSVNNKLFSIPGNSNNRKRDIRITMIEEFSDDLDIQEALLKYYNIRVKRGLSKEEWKIILDDLEYYSNGNKKVILDEINSSIAGRYGTIVPRWNKGKRYNQIGLKGDFNSFDNTSKMDITRKEDKPINQMTDEEYKRWQDKHLMKDEDGNFLEF